MIFVALSEFRLIKLCAELCTKMAIKDVKFEKKTLSNCTENMKKWLFCKILIHKIIFCADSRNFCADMLSRVLKACPHFAVAKLILIYGWTHVNNILFDHAHFTEYQKCSTSASDKLDTCRCRMKILLDDLLVSMLKLCKDERLQPTPGRLPLQLDVRPCTLYMEWRSTVMTLSGSNRLFANLLHRGDVLINWWNTRAVQ